MTSITFFIIFIPILSILLLFINLVLAPHNPYQEKDSVFECGYHSFLGQNRTQFSVSFFIFALLFLLFDLEILLVYPYSVSGHNNGAYGLVIMMIFFVLLTLGFIFELGKNALTIDSKQVFSNNNVSVPELLILRKNFKDTNILNKFGVLNNPILKSKINITEIFFLLTFFTHCQIFFLMFKKSLDINCVTLILLLISSILLSITLQFIRCKFYKKPFFLGFIQKYIILIKLILIVGLFIYNYLELWYVTVLGISEWYDYVLCLFVLEFTVLYIYIIQDYLLSVFPYIECSSSSKASESFKGLDVKIDTSTSKPLTDIENIVCYPKIDIDTSNIDNLLRELKTNMNSLNEVRVNNIKNDINNNFETLRYKAREAIQTFGVDFNNILSFFSKLRYKDEFKKDVPVLFEKLGGLMGTVESPNKDLLQSDPITYWTQSITFANQSQNNTNHMLKLFKNFIKDNGVFSTNDKTILFTAIKNMQKNASNIASADKILFKQQLENSKILKELENSKRI